MPEETVFKPTAAYNKKLDTPLLQLKEYFISKGEWVADNRQTINRSNVVSSTTTIYTVPVNKKLFITSCFASALKNGATAGTTAGYLQVAGTPNVVLVGCLIQDQYAHDSNSISFPMPIRVNAGEIVQLVCAGSNMSTLGGFNGYLEDF